MGMIAPLIALTVGLAGGVGGAYFLGLSPVGPTIERSGEEGSEAAEAGPEDGTDATVGYAKLANQFIVPIFNDEEMEGIVVMSIALAVPEERREAIYLAEPLLRDGFLQVLFDHANLGGFSGDFTSIRNMEVLRRKLLEKAQGFPVGKDVAQVLITEIGRQDF